jgi:2-polyprenyl-3-methyl-5-hydroxy-6-metoxy-1,4-benzoquinol methylase
MCLCGSKLLLPDKMSLESVSICPICSSFSFTKFLTATDHTTTGEKFEIVKCAKCDFTITNPRPDINSIGKYYQSEKYISHTGGSKSLFDKVYVLARTITLRWKLKLINKHKSTGSILDYGCGTGEFLHHLKSNSWAINGVEPSEGARNKATDLLQKPISSSIEKIEGNQFDVITLWHVLEHIHDLNEKLSSIKSLLKQDGIIFIAVPNHESPDAQKYGAYWAGYDVPRHLWHFSKDSMKKLLDKTGLELVSIHPMKLDAYYVSLLSEGYEHQNQNKIVSAIKSLWSGLSSNLTASKNQNYSSLIYIAKKR